MATAEVILWGRKIGIVTDDNGYVEFSYDPKFVGAGIELAPLAMPVTNRIYPFSELEERKPYYWKNLWTSYLFAIIMWKKCEALLMLY